MSLFNKKSKIDKQSISNPNPIATDVVTNLEKVLPDLLMNSFQRAIDRHAESQQAMFLANLERVLPPALTTALTTALIDAVETCLRRKENVYLDTLLKSLNPSNSGVSPLLVPMAEIIERQTKLNLEQHNRTIAKLDKLISESRKNAAEVRALLTDTDKKFEDIDARMKVYDYEIAKIAEEDFMKTAPFSRNRLYPREPDAKP